MYTFLVHLAEVGPTSTISEPVSVTISAVSNTPMATPTPGEQFVDKHHPCITHWSIAIVHLFQHLYIYQ